MNKQHLNTNAGVTLTFTYLTAGPDVWRLKTVSTARPQPHAQWFARLLPYV